MRQRSKERRDSRRSNATHLAIAVLSALLVLAPFSASQGVPDLTEAPADAEQEWVVNLLVVDGQTGEVKGWTDNGVLFTDVRVTDVESAASGYNLHGPRGEESFLNQSSTFAGYVEFYNQILGPGAYRVTQSTEGESRFVVEFDATTYAAHVDVDERDLLALVGEPEDPEAFTGARGGSSGGGSGGSGGSSDCSTASSGSFKATKLGEKTLWTPLVVGHAPYLGSGTASIEWSSGKGIYYSHGYGGGAYTSSKTTKETVDIDDGGSTGGVFQLAKWGHYKNVYRDRCGFVYTTYQAKVLDWAPTGSAWVKAFDLWGSSKTTDTDDLESVSYGGYGSVAYKTRYQTKDKMVQTSSGTGVTSSVSSGTYSKFDTGLSFSQGSVTVATTLQATTGTTNAWTYSFPKGDDYCWHVDYLGDGSTGGWAFKYIGSNGC